MMEYEKLLIYLSIFSLICFVASIFIIPFLVIRISPAYFREKRKPIIDYKNPVLRYLVLILKNIFGFIFILLGFLMLFIPGQGLLSIAIGIFFINFPGKKKLEYKIFTHPKISSAVNYIRRKAGKEEIFFK